MSDIFREVEEDVRRERLERFWKRYGYYLIALVVLILAAVGAWGYWQHLQTQQRLEASQAYAAAQRITDPAQSVSAFAEIAKNSSGGYKLLARMSEANALYATGQIKSAVDIYREIGNSDRGEIGNAARLRAAWIISATASRADLEGLLAPLNRDDSAWQPMAHEVLAFSDYRASKIAASAKAFRALSENARAPEALRNRARAMALFLENGAGADIGTVPDMPATSGAPLPGTAQLPEAPQPAQ